MEPLSERTSSMGVIAEVALVRNLSADDSSVEVFMPQFVLKKRLPKLVQRRAFLLPAQIPKLHASPLPLQKTRTHAKRFGVSERLSVAIAMAWLAPFELADTGGGASLIASCGDPPGKMGQRFVASSSRPTNLRASDQILKAA